MELEMMAEYLVAVALPLWLLVELVAHRLPSKPDWLSGRSISRVSPAAPPRTAKLEDSRKVA